MAEPFFVASNISDVIKQELPDIILFGAKASDDENSQVGPIVAALLDVPFLANVTSFEITENVVKSEIEIEGATEIIESLLPVAISIQKGKTEPRIASMMDIRNANKKEIKKFSAKTIESYFKIEKIEPPLERKGGKIVGEGAKAVPELIRLLKEEAKVL